YCQAQKAYKVYDIATHCILSSRDIIFYEHIFLYKHIPLDSPPIPMPTPIPEDDSNTQPSTFHHSIVVPQPTTSVPDSTIDVPVTSVHPTQPQRTITKPVWLQDYMGRLIVIKLDLWLKVTPKLKLDVNNAFLHGHFNEEVYMFPPEGLELAHSSHGTYVTQCKYLRDILADCKMQDACSVSTPPLPGICFVNTAGALLHSPDCYRRLIGRLLYLGFSRPDISFAVQQLSQFLHYPGSLTGMLPCTCCITSKILLHLVSFFPASTSLQLCSYSDSDWASCSDARWSITGFCIFLGVLSFLGNPRSKPRCQGHLWRQSIGA
ncbi:UNVERIFIED_CONTAM: Retrovirus-related Pol polyprotein from transposon RE1, partial [Sesamum radiatum]